MVLNDTGNSIGLKQSVCQSILFQNNVIFAQIKISWGEF